MKKNVLLNKLSSSKKSFLIFLLTICTSFSVFAQTRQVSGKVTASDNGETLPGVSVKIKGTSTGTITDVTGAFKLSLAPDAVLVISYVGYATQEINTGTSTTINVKLSPDINTLSEVAVVSIGYGTQKRTDLTGAISSVSAATIAKVPVTTLEQSIQGRAAGVQVTNNDASPGGNVTILIRGTGSLAGGGNAPLYVVDGYPLEGVGLNTINPSDIASIDILKDASATAIYGIRAANGVVLISTKRGKKDGVVVSLDAYNAFQAKPKEYNVLNAQQFATMANAVAAADASKQFNVPSFWSNPASLNEADWQNAVYGSALTQNYSLALRGGNDKIQTSTSIGYYDQKGIVIASYFKRITLGFNADYQPSKWLKLTTNARYSYQNQNTPLGTGNLGVIAQLPPTLDGGNKALYNGNPVSEIKTPDGQFGFFNPVYTYVAKWYNPVYSALINKSQGINNLFADNTSLEATILPGLKLKTNAGITMTNSNGYYDAPEDDRLVNQYGSQAGATQNANYSQALHTSFDWVWENFLTYDKTFGKHTINFVGGVSEQEINYQGFSGSGVPPNGTIQDLSQVTNLTLNTTAPYTESTASQFARLSYNYASKYFLTGTVRRDGSSKFADGHQYGVFPSGAIAWKAKEESFLKNVDWLSNLKFRASYGKLGNEIPIPAFRFQSLYSTGSASTTSGNLGYPFDKVYQAGIAAVNPDNPLLRWETDYESDFGADLGFLHGDLTITIDYFNRKSQDFLLDITVPPQTGYNTEAKNVGTMNNKGWEFTASYNHNFGKDLRFGASFNISFLKNTLTSITSGTNAIGNLGSLGLTGQGWSQFTKTYVGQSVGEFYGFQSVGIIQSQAQIDALNANASAKSNGLYKFYYLAATGPGDRLFKDVNGDGTVNAADEVSLGSPQPKFFGGINLDGSYKQWDFNLYFYGVYGNKILNYVESNLETFQGRGSVSIENVSTQYYQNAWTPTNPSNKYSRILYNDDSNQNGVPSSNWIEDGSFLKLKTVVVGYTLANDLVKKLSLSKLRFYVSSQNLFTITGYKGLDPEIGAQGGYATQTGIDNGTYPSSRYLTVGVNATF